MDLYPMTPRSEGKVEMIHVRTVAMTLALAAGVAMASQAEGLKVPAFPGAEGAGAATPGGRGGAVLVVTNLSDSGPGSLRAAVEAKGPRIVVFGVAGLITLERPLDIQNPYITLAGQTAPGDGVCIRGESVHINTHDVIVRYLRFRRGSFKVRDDALGGYPVSDIIVDHVSASWGLDENLSLYRWIKDEGGKQLKMPLERVTIQWSITSEALNRFNHAFGGTWGGNPCSFHHNLFACNTGRNPSIGMNGEFDFRNNVIFNWAHRTADGGDGSSRVNLVNNYFKPGPATEGDLRHRIAKMQARWQGDDHPGCGLWYIEGNHVDGFPKITANNWDGGIYYNPAERAKDTIVPQATEAEVRSLQEFKSPPVATETAEAAYEHVLAHAGASLPRRDPVDLRVIETVRTGRPTFKNGIIDDPAEVGGWPRYEGGPAPADSDRDGMPDAWEQSHGLNPADPADASKDGDGDGYTAIEEYLNGTDPAAFVDYTKPENNRSTLISSPAPGARR
jgi:pectate lyase